MTRGGLRPEAPHGRPSSVLPAATDRAELEAEWLHLTREVLPALAGARGWPVRNDHCFQRILLDNACGARWYDRIADRPAYRHAPDETLRHAVDLARAVRDGEADLTALNARSLTWRGKL